VEELGKVVKRISKCFLREKIGHQEEYQNPGLSFDLSKPQGIGIQQR